MNYKNATMLKSETHQALGEAIQTFVKAMGPKQRIRVARTLAETAGDYEGPAAKLLLNLALYVEPGR